MKQIFFITALIILTACGTVSKQYLLSVDRTQISQKPHRSTQIGVDKIIVPGYMEESQIATQQEGAQISYRKEIWAVPTPKALTNTLIQSLQKKFSNPNVFLFPWDVEKEGGIRVKVTINQFIYHNGTVGLEATYYIKRIGSTDKRSYLFSTQVASGGDTSDIVEAMGRAFGKLVEEIGGRISL